MSEEANVGPEDVVAFWREAGRDKWFKKDAEFDREHRGALRAPSTPKRRRAKKRDWAKTPEGALALILVLDQFSRNMFRGSPKAFAQDEMASELAREAIAAGFDLKVAPELAPFFHMPFMHSERIADQEHSVLYFHALGVGRRPALRPHPRAGDPPLRTLSASQSGARTPYDAGGAGLSRRRRIRRVKRLKLNARIDGAIERSRHIASRCADGV